MAKRYSETEKYKQQWHRKLSLEAKLFWDYLCLRADNSGVWQVDYEGASFDIGRPINESHFNEINEEKERIRFSKDKKFIVIFGHIDFHCGNLLQENLTNLQKSAIKLMYKHVEAKRFTKEEFGFTGKLPVSYGYKYKEDKNDKEDKKDKGVKKGGKVKKEEKPFQHPPPPEFLELKEKIGNRII